MKDGEIFGLLGPNGAGKSTLIRMMTTLIPITSGKAFIAGYDVSENADAARRMMGVIPQAMTSDIDLTIEENMSIYAKLYGVPRAERERNINELLEAVDLVKWRGAQVKTLSGGMRRRAEIARGLVHNPRIFFLDEPTTGLDPVSRVAVWEMLNTLKSRRQLTILITTHYMDEADRLCDRIAIVDHGNLVALDSPMALKSSVPGNNVVEAQFVDPPAGWLEQLRALPGVESVQDEGGNMYPPADLDRLADHHRAGGACGARRSGDQDAHRAEHLARRCIRSLHRPSASRRAGKGFRLRNAGRAQECGHEPNVCDYRARDAQVLPLADADGDGDDLSAGAAHHSGQCFRGKDSRCAGRDCR